MRRKRTLKNCCPNPNGNHQSWDPYEARARWMLWKRSRGGLQAIVAQEAREHGWTFEAKGPSRRAPNPGAWPVRLGRMQLKRVSAPPHFSAKCVKCGRMVQTVHEPLYADLKGRPFKDYYCAKCVGAPARNPLPDYPKKIRTLVRTPDSKAGTSAIEAVYAYGMPKKASADWVDHSRKMGRRAAECVLTNPPTYFVIDPKTNVILAISRGHPMKSYDKGFWLAQKSAKTIGRNVLLVVHPYIPAGFKVGVEVSPLFHHYGAVEVTPKGEALRNPLNRAEQARIAHEERQRIGYAQKYDVSGDHASAEHHRGVAQGMGYVRERYGVKKNPAFGFNVYLGKKWIDTVFYTPSKGTSVKEAEEEVRKSLISHDGYDPGIRVSKKRWTKKNPLLQTVMPMLGNPRRMKRSRHANPKLSFEAWMRAVDRAVQLRVGLSISDLPDAPFRDWYEDGVSSSSAASRVVRSASENPQGPRIRYEVQVGNIGNVYSGTSKMEAERTFNEYVSQSKKGYGRAAGESVTLMVGEDIGRSYIGPVDRTENPQGPRSRFRHKRKARPGMFDPRSFRTVRRGKHRIVIGCPKGKWSARRRKCLVGTRAQSVLHPKGERRNAGYEVAVRHISGRTLKIRGTGPEAGMKALIVGKDLTRPGNWIVQVVGATGQRVGASRYSIPWTRLRSAMMRGYLKSEPGSDVKNPHKACANPPTSRAPFRDGQKVPVEKYRAWLTKGGTKDQVEDFDRAVKLQTTANAAPKQVLFKRVEMGPKLTGRMALVKYGETDEHTYKAPKGSKKGNGWWRHRWTDGGKKRVPLLVDSTGKNIITLLGKGQVINDWMR